MGMRSAWAVILVLSPAAEAGAVAAAGDEMVKVFDRAEIHWDEESAKIVEDDGFVVRRQHDVARLDVAVDQSLFVGDV